MKRLTVCLWVMLFGDLLPQTWGHGFMKSPPARSYAWLHFRDFKEFNGFFPVNYDYNQNYCGGFGVQYNSRNRGKCGVCGDEYRLPRPRPHERGGKYSTGNIVAQYASGGIIDVSIVLTANHGGQFYFDLCRSEDPKTPEEETCFKRLDVYSRGRLLPGYEVPNRRAATFRVQVYIPEEVTCTYCVLRWRYKTGNHWGCKEDNPSECCTGCSSKQEHFYSCADVMITSTGSEVRPPWGKPDQSATVRPPVISTPVPAMTTTRRTTTTTTTTTTLAPVKGEPQLCRRLCNYACKRNSQFRVWCIPSICGYCKVYYEFVYLLQAIG